MDQEVVHAHGRDVVAEPFERHAVVPRGERELLVADELALSEAVGGVGGCHETCVPLQPIKGNPRSGREHDSTGADDQPQVVEGRGVIERAAAQRDQVGGRVRGRAERGPSPQHLLGLQSGLAEEQDLSGVDAGGMRPVPEVGPVDDRSAGSVEPAEVVDRRPDLWRVAAERMDVEGRHDPQSGVRPPSTTSSESRRPRRVRELVEAGAERSFHLTSALRVDRDRQVEPMGSSQIATSSASLGVGPASAFKETLIAAAPRLARSRTAATASSGPSQLEAGPGGAQPAFVG